MIHSATQSLVLISQLQGVSWQTTYDEVREQLQDEIEVLRTTLTNALDEVDYLL
jgi:hypothetical protein